MDIKVSKKEKRYQPSGNTEVLVSNIFDIYPKFDDIDKNLIVDIEVLDNDREELLDRAMFAAIKQRGADPLDPTSGVQWAESLAGEVNVATIINQVQASVQKEGPGVRVDFGTVRDSEGKRFFQFSVKLTNAT